VEAAYLLLFEDVGQGLSLLQRDLKMLFSGFPLARRNYRDTRDGPCENARAARAEWKQHRASSNTAALSAPFLPFRQSAGLRQRTIPP
jgi:hypothetical protein